MQILGLILILITVGSIAVPVAGVVIIYSDDLSQLIIPSELEEVLSETINTDESIELPVYVSSTYDISSRTVEAIFRFTNPFDFDITLNILSADLECLAHHFSLGSASLNNEVQINGGETEDMIINFMWTVAAEDHFLNEHATESTITIQLMNIQLDVCLLYTSPSPRDRQRSRMPSSA